MMVALLAQTWLVMNNPICLSLLRELLVLHAHTEQNLSHIPSKQPRGIRGERARGRQRCWVCPGLQISTERLR